MAGEHRSYVAGNFSLDLGGVKCGILKSVDGGGVLAEVIAELIGPTYFAKKHIGQPKYEDFTLEIGFTMGKAVYDWIAASWQMKYQRKNGSIVASDYNLNTTSQQDFFNALLTETTIPTCDGSAKAPAYLTLKIAPEYTRYAKASAKSTSESGKTPQKMWLPSNFRLEIDGLDCSKVSKIDAFTVKVTIVQDEIGDARDYAKEPGRLDFPNLKITLSDATSTTWRDWFDDFVIKGNNTDDKEKKGRLVFLSPDRQT